MTLALVSRPADTGLAWVRECVSEEEEEDGEEGALLEDEELDGTCAPVENHASPRSTVSPPGALLLTKSDEYTVVYVCTGGASDDIYMQMQRGSDAHVY
jgi:hypothetical protein